jgi:hypothetical protein
MLNPAKHLSTCVLDPFKNPNFIPGSGMKRR